MSSKPRQIVVTSALPYANGPIHIGHMLEYVQTDIWVRFQKLRGHDCTYVCADDAHGTPIMLRAQAEGITPEALIERMHKEHSQDFADFGVAFDNYYSTHSDENRHYSELIYTRLREHQATIFFGAPNAISAPLSDWDTDRSSNSSAPLRISILSRVN